MLMECVPNFSEGKDTACIEALKQAVGQVPEVSLLHVDPGPSANRTVFTFAGAPAAVVEAAFQMVRGAVRHIDMRVQQGAHPRVGAADVVPLIPLTGMSLAQADAWAQQLGERIGRELDIPVYMYESSAKQAGRRNLADIRRGGYEGFAAKMRQPDWLPDYGPNTWRPRSGACVVGVRPLLLAYNINLDGAGVKLARRIAASVRAAGPKRRAGVSQPGKDGAFGGLKAIGWYMAQFARCQVSMNITRLQQAPLHLVYDAVARLARAGGAGLFGSEAVGLLPKRPLLEAAAYWLQAQGLDQARIAAKSEQERLLWVVEHLGLAAVKNFDPRRRILEYALASRFPNSRFKDLTACSQACFDLSSTTQT